MKRVYFFVICCLLISVPAGAGPIPDLDTLQKNAESFPPLMIQKQPQAGTDNSALQGTKVRDWRELLSGAYFEPVINNTSEKHALSDYQADIQFQAIASSVDGTFNMSQDMNQDV